MRLLQIYTSPEAQELAWEPQPYGADRPQAADEARVIFVHVKELTSLARTSCSCWPAMPKGTR
jgi:hypothetical protein